MNVFGYQTKDNDIHVRKEYVYQQKISNQPPCDGDTIQHVVNLLLISNDEGTIQHYCCITDLSRLVSLQKSKHEHKLNICPRCLNGFTSVECLNKHTEYCKTNDVVQVSYPKKGTKINFTHHFKKMRVPFVVYADFEAFTEPLDTCKPNPNKSYTNKYQKHAPCSFSYYIIMNFIHISQSRL